MPRCPTALSLLEHKCESSTCPISSTTQNARTEDNEQIEEVKGTGYAKREFFIDEVPPLTLIDLPVGEPRRQIIGMVEQGGDSCRDHLNLRPSLLDTVTECYNQNYPAGTRQLNHAADIQCHTGNTCGAKEHTRL